MNHPRMLQTKTREQARQLRSLVDHTPSLYALLCWVDELAWQTFRKRITITSIFRDDGGIHSTWRAADCRVRQEWHQQGELEWEEWDVLVKRINRKFIYGRTRDGRETVCAHLLEQGERGSTADHVHIQVPSHGWQGQQEQIA